MKKHLSFIIHYVIVAVLLALSIQGNEFCKNVLNALVTFNFIIISFLTTIVTCAYLFAGDRFQQAYAKSTNPKPFEPKNRGAKALISAVFAAIMFGMGWYIIGTMAVATILCIMILEDTVKNITQSCENTTDTE